MVTLFFLIYFLPEQSFLEMYGYFQLRERSLDSTQNLQRSKEALWVLLVVHSFLSIQLVSCFEPILLRIPKSLSENIYYIISLFLAVRILRVYASEKPKRAVG